MTRLACRAYRSTAPQTRQVVLTFAAWACVLPLICQAQVQNLRFDDTDTSVDTVGGIVLWEAPAAGTGSAVSYELYLTAGAIGTSPTHVGSVPVGAWTSEFTIPSGTSKTGKSYVAVYLRSSSGTLSDIAAACLMDNPTDFARTVHVTAVGYTNAAGAKSALVAGCHTAEHSIAMDMVATAAWDSGGSSVVTTEFDDTNEQSESAAFCLTFQTGASFTDIESAMSAYTSDSPVPPVFVGTGADSSYSMGTVTMASSYDVFVPTRPDPDVGHMLAHSCVLFSVASAAVVNRAGEVRLQTKADKQTAIQEMANVYQGWSTVSFADLGAGASTLSAIDARATASQAACHQITSDAAHVSCVDGAPL